MDFPRQLKRTKQRVEILNILEKQEAPVTVAELYRITVDKGCRMNYSTIYRTLTAFGKAGIVTEYNASITDEAVYELKRESHRHYAICLKCHKKIPIENCPVSEHITELEENDFEVTEHRVEFFGYCHDCRKNAIKSKATAAK